MPPRLPALPCVAAHATRRSPADCTFAPSSANAPPASGHTNVLSRIRRLSQSCC